jgi:hypothetical protein
VRAVPEADLEAAAAAQVHGALAVDLDVSARVAGVVEAHSRIERARREERGEPGERSA